MTVGEALREGARRLRLAGVDNPALDARLLLGHARGQDQAGLLRDRGEAVAFAPFDALLRRREAREPVALILGRAGFWSLEFAVSDATLVPRADSETLIEAAVAAASEASGAARREVGSVLDLGTGTGCLLLAALTEFRAAWGVGVDRSAAAATLARRNAAALGLSGRAAFLCGDWAAALGTRFDLVLGNPPYIASREIDGLMPEVAMHEPRSALDGGADGLVAYRAIIAALPDLLAPGGLAVLELGAGQAGPVGALAAAAGFGTSVRADGGGIGRALLLEKGIGRGARPH